MWDLSGQPLPCEENYLSVYKQNSNGEILSAANVKSPCFSGVLMKLMRDESG